MCSVQINLPARTEDDVWLTMNTLLTLGWHLSYPDITSPRNQEWDKDRKPMSLDLGKVELLCTPSIQIDKEFLLILTGTRDCTQAYHKNQWDEWTIVVSCSLIHLPDLNNRTVSIFGKITPSHSVSKSSKIMIDHLQNDI